MSGHTDTRGAERGAPNTHARSTALARGNETGAAPRSKLRGCGRHGAERTRHRPHERGGGRGCGHKGWRNVGIMVCRPSGERTAAPWGRRPVQLVCSRGAPFGSHIRAAHGNVGTAQVASKRARRPWVSSVVSKVRPQSPSHTTQTPLPRAGEHEAAGG